MKAAVEATHDTPGAGVLQGLGSFGGVFSADRIVAMKVGAFKGVRYFESDGGLWSKSFANRDVGSGTRRTVSINANPVVPTARIAWQGPSPKQACEANLAKQRAKGMRKSAVLAKTCEDLCHGLVLQEETDHIAGACPVCVDNLALFGLKVKRI